jgi:hypothetical protein
VPPWVLLTALVAAINLTAFMVIRGRWGRLSLALALAAVGGTMLGNMVGERIDADLLRVGDFNVVAASVAAQLAMLATILLAALLPDRPRD